MKFAEIMEEIRKNHYERAVVQVLMDDILKELDQEKKKSSEYRACLRNVAKINKGKDKYIDALCEVEDENH